jgi:TetR/AcrR family transcriptional repressor of nem operon
MGRVSDARERLVQATIDLIWVEGYAAVTVDLICERAKVKKGSFYHFFAAKEDLVLAALDWHWADRRPILDELFSPSKAPMERFEAYFEHIYQRQLQHKKRCGQYLGCFYSAVGLGAAKQSPEIAKKVQTILGNYERYYESALTEAAAKRQVKIDGIPGKAKALFAFMEGILLQARLQDDPEIVRDLGRRAFEFLGIAKRRAA